MKKVCTLLDYVHVTTNNRINGKHPLISIIQIYIIVRFHIQRCFRVSLSVGVSDSGRPATCARKYRTIGTCHKLQCWIPACSSRHYILLHTPMIMHTKTIFVPTCHLIKKILSETKLSHSPLLHPHILHTSSPTSKYDSKIDSIRSDNFPLGRIRNKSIQPQLRVG